MSSNLATGRRATRHGPRARPFVKGGPVEWGTVGLLRLQRGRGTSDRRACAAPLARKPSRGTGFLVTPSPLGGEGLGVRGLELPSPSPPAPLPRGERGASANQPCPLA